MSPILRDQQETIDRVVRKNWGNAHVPEQKTPLEQLIAAEERGAAEERDEDEEMAGKLKEMRWQTFRATLAYLFQNGPEPLEVLRMTFGLAKTVRPELLGGMSLEDLALLCGDGGKATASARLKRIYNRVLEKGGQRGQASYQKRGDYAAAQMGNTNRKKKGPGGK